MTEPIPEVLQQLAQAANGTIEEIGRLPDGSGFAVMSMPLPEGHWSTANPEALNEPPARFRMGTGPTRDALADIVREAGRYAYRASTRNGREPDMDPDALLQNLVVAFLGYWTADGRSDLDDVESL